MGSSEVIPRPDYWHGYHIAITMIEFWLAQENRVHQRLRYELVNNTWQARRLQP